METTNQIVRNALAANAAPNAHLKAYRESAKSAIREIRDSGNGELNRLSGFADRYSGAAKHGGDAKAWSDINRIQGMLETALAKFYSDALRIIGV